MTCSSVLNVLIEYHEGTLSNEKQDAISSHLVSCCTCRLEAEETRALVDTMRSQSLTDPGDGYFKEVTQLILARTIEYKDNSRTTCGENTIVRESSLLRSVISATVSVSVLVAAILVGSSDHFRPAKLVSAGEPFYLTASLSELEGDRLQPMITDNEMKQLAQASVVLGVPGLLGRSFAISNLLEFE